MALQGLLQPCEVTAEPHGMTCATATSADQWMTRGKLNGKPPAALQDQTAAQTMEPKGTAT